MQVLQGAAIATGVNKANLKVRTFTPPRNDMQVLQGVAITTEVNKTNLKVSTFTPLCNDSYKFSNSTKIFAKKFF